MRALKVTMDQWVMFQAVVETGSFSGAAEKLHKSQSTISYGLTKMQSKLGVILYEIKGRKAVLTEAGKKMHTHAERLTRIAYDIEECGRDMVEGLECELNFVFDGMLPRKILLQMLAEYGALNSVTQLNVSEGLLSGPTQALESGAADIVITSHVPPNFVGYKLLDIETIPCAHEDSELHAFGRPINMNDLTSYRNIIARDSGTINRTEGWLGATKSWKVDSLSLKRDLMSAGVGFAWAPKYVVHDSSNPLKPLEMLEGGCRTVPLYVASQSIETLGPSGKQLLEVIMRYAT